MMILGGTARVEGLTSDAYAAVVCHELGHLLAGTPLQTIPFAQWSSAEDTAPIRLKADTTKVSATLINNYLTLQCRYENFRNPAQHPACWYNEK